MVNIATHIHKIQAIENPENIIIPINMGFLNVFAAKEGLHNLVERNFEKNITIEIPERFNYHFPDSLPYKIHPFYINCQQESTTGNRYNYLKIISYPKLRDAWNPQEFEEYRQTTLKEGIGIFQKDSLHIPKSIKKRAKLRGKLTVFDAVSHLTIWNQEEFEHYIASTDLNEKNEMLLYQIMDKVGI